LRHGKGKYTHSDGTVSEGDWLNDYQHGKGYETFAVGDHLNQKIHIGEWKEGKLHGLGRIVWRNGHVCTGQYA